MQSVDCLQSTNATQRKQKNYKKFWWLNDVKQLGWCSWEASISSGKNSEPLELDQVKAVTPMLACFNWHKRYFKLRIRESRNFKVDLNQCSHSIVRSLILPPEENNKKFCWLIDIYHIANGAGKKRNHMTKKNMKLWSEPKSMKFLK